MYKFSYKYHFHIYSDVATYSHMCSVWPQPLAFLDYFWRLVKNFKFEEKSPQAKKSELDLTSCLNFWC